MPPERNSGGRPVYKLIKGREHVRRDTLFAHLSARDQEREEGKGEEEGRDKEQERAGKPSARRSDHSHRKERKRWAKERA